MVTRVKKAKVLKISKKQLAHLDKAEARKLAVFGMGLGLKSSFEMTPTEMVSWIYDNQESLVSTDVQACDADRLFRPGVVTYLVGLQAYLRGDGDIPEWNNDATPDAPTDAEIGNEDEAVGPSPLHEPHDDDGEGEAELVDFPDDEPQGEQPVQEKPKMTKPTMRAGTTAAPATFIRRGPAPAAVQAPVEVVEAVEEPDDAQDDAGLEDEAAPTSAPSNVGISSEDIHALIEMVSTTSERVSDLGDNIDNISTSVADQLTGLRAALDVQGLHRKVDHLGIEMREMSANLMYLSNSVAMLLNFWRPMGEPYSNLADVPDPSTYIDDLGDLEDEG